MPRYLPILVAAMLPAAATADTALTITFDMQDVTTASYNCGDGGVLNVVYVSSETQGLALVPVNDDSRVFAQAVSGSGARYVSGQYEWLSKGGSALLIDTLEETTLLDCGPV